jgi:hypothetical protein
MATLDIDEGIRYVPETDVKIIYTTLDNNEPMAVTGRTESGNYALITLLPQILPLGLMAEDIDPPMGDYIFLLDRSGSMSG